MKTSQAQWRDLPNEKQALCTRDGNDQLAIFVHGFQLLEGLPLSGRLISPGYLGAWNEIVPAIRSGTFEGNPLPGHLLKWDYAFLGYTTAGISTYLDIAERLQRFLNSRECGKYRSLALIGHSLGCLGIRQLLCAQTLHPDKFLERLRFTIFFAPADYGSKLARFLTPALKAARALTPSSPQLRMLKVWTECAATRSDWSPLHVVRATNDRVVLHPTDPTNYNWIQANHRSIKDPAKWDSKITQTILEKFA